MSSELPEPKWARILSLAVHELRGPLSVGLGYTSLLTRFDPPLTDRQLFFATESQKAWGRIRTLADEITELSNLEAGTLKLHRRSMTIADAVADAVAALPPEEDRTVTVDVSLAVPATTISGDPARLKTALSSILFGVRREMVTSKTLLVREQHREYNGRPASWIALGDPTQVERLSAGTPQLLGAFDEWRGGCGLKPPIARRLIESHDGAVWSPADGTKAAAVLVLPT